jgi:hypothetical protein
VSRLGLVRCKRCSRIYQGWHCVRCHHSYATQAALESHQLHGHRQAVSGDRPWSAMNPAEVTVSLRPKP